MRSLSFCWKMPCKLWDLGIQGKRRIWWSAIFTTRRNYLRKSNNNNNKPKDDFLCEEMAGLLKRKREDCEDNGEDYGEDFKKIAFLEKNLKERSAGTRVHAFFSQELERILDKHDIPKATFSCSSSPKPLPSSPLSSSFSSLSLLPPLQGPPPLFRKSSF